MTDSRNQLEQKKSIERPTKKQKNLQAIVTRLTPLITQAKDTGYLITQAKDTAQYIPAYLDIKSLASVLVTCRRARTLFSESLSKRVLQKLLQHVVHGEENQARAIIKNQPKLLLKADTVIDPAGRTLLHVTPITAAYGADDVEMCEMMFEYLDEDREIAIDHIRETFPEEKESVSYDFNPIVAAITANKNVEGILEQFRNDFTLGVIKKGKHFNMKILIDAYQAYYDNWAVVQGYNNKYAAPYSLFFCQVIGYLQRLLPACYVQVFCQGFSNVTEGGKTLQRGLKLDGVPFYSDILKTGLCLGFDFGIYSDAYGGRPVLGTTRAEAQRMQQALTNLCRIKTSAMRELMQRPDNQAKQACAIS